MLRATIDTNAVDPATLRRIGQAAAGRAVELAHTTVTVRELERSDIEPPAGKPIRRYVGSGRPPPVVRSSSRTRP